MGSKGHRIPELFMDRYQNFNILGKQTNVKSTKSNDMFLSTKSSEKYVKAQPIYTALKEHECLQKVDFYDSKIQK